VLVEHEAAQPRVALSVDDTVHREMIGRECRPDWQKQARREADRLDLGLPCQFGDLFGPLGLERGAIDHVPSGLEQVGLADIFTPARALQFEPRDRLPLFVHPRASV
jgi:hypothetical protein